MYIDSIVEKGRNCSLGAISPLFHNILLPVVRFPCWTHAIQSRCTGWSLLVIQALLSVCCALALVILDTDYRTTVYSKPHFVTLAQKVNYSIKIYIRSYLPFALRWRFGRCKAKSCLEHAQKKKNNTKNKQTLDSSHSYALSFWDLLSVESLDSSSRQRRPWSGLSLSA